jgi:hypothetical protein
MIGARVDAFEQPRPAIERQGVLAAHRKIRAGAMQPGQRLADGGALARVRLPDPHAVEKGDDGGGAPREDAQRPTLPVLDRLRAGDALDGKMLEQAEEEGQLRLVHPLLIEGEDVEAPLRVQEVIGVFDALGDALERQHAADVVAGDESVEFFFAHFGIDGHVGSRGNRPSRALRAPAAPC